jgi:flagellar hook-associated protein 1
MSSIGTLFDIAKTAMAAHQTGLSVTANNIANVGTEGYSRQSLILSPKASTGSGSLQLGRGVSAEYVARSSNKFIEEQLMEEKSNLASWGEMETYIAILEGIFDESSGTGLNTQMTEFWNLWNDLSNNPSGDAERISLYEQSLLLCDQFKGINTDLTQLEIDISSAVVSGIDKVNQLSAEIAALNGQIVGTGGATSMANNLNDQLNIAFTELSEYLDVDTFAQDNGTITVVTAKGCVLAQGTNSYDLEAGGADGDRIIWQGSGDSNVDITDEITNGKIGGWLTVRDETIAESKLALDALASELIWNVNGQHSQGVGLNLFEPGTTLTGTYQTNTDLGDLSYGDQIEFVGDAFTMWIEDRTDPLNPSIADVSVDLSSLDSSASLSDLANLINTQITAAGLTGVTADGSGTGMRFTSGNDYAFGFSDDQSNLLAVLGINTYFDGSGSGSIGINAVLEDKDYIAAAQIAEDGSYASGDNTNVMAITDLQFQSIQIAQWTCDRKNGNSEGSTSATLEGYYQSMVSSIGIAAASIYNSKSASETMANNLNTLRDSISGVSLDEEMANLTMYQNAYEAAAKLLAVADEMLQTLLDLK